MIKLVLIVTGGGLGSLLRFLINNFFRDFVYLMLPMGIMIVNFLGCFLIGIAMTQITELKSNLYFFLVIGFLGSFTTMSAFSQQTIEMLYNEKGMSALIYIIASISSCLIGTYLGYSLFKTT